MKRIVLLVTLAAVMMVATVTMAGTSFAQSETGSCFSQYTSTAPGPQDGPGEAVSKVATTAASPGEGKGEGGSETDDLAKDVGVVNQAREEVPGC